MGEMEETSLQCGRTILFIHQIVQMLDNTSANKLDDYRHRLVRIIPWINKDIRMQLT